MRRKIVTPTGEAELRAIATFIAMDNPAAAERYLAAAREAFERLPDLHVPVRASAHLPEHVRVLRVPGFAGYTLRIAIFETETYLVAAFRPGLPDAFKDARTLAGLGKVRDC